MSVSDMNETVGPISWLYTTRHPKTTNVTSALVHPSSMLRTRDGWLRCRGKNSGGDVDCGFGAGRIANEKRVASIGHLSACYCLLNGKGS